MTSKRGRQMIKVFSNLVQWSWAFIEGSRMPKLLIRVRKCQKNLLLRKRWNSISIKEYRIHPQRSWITPPTPYSTCKLTQTPIWSSPLRGMLRWRSKYLKMVLSQIFRRWLWVLWIHKIWIKWSLWWMLQAYKITNIKIKDLSRFQTLKIRLESPVLPPSVLSARTRKSSMITRTDSKKISSFFKVVTLRYLELGPCSLWHRRINKKELQGIKDFRFDSATWFLIFTLKIESVSLHIRIKLNIWI